ncbi:RNA methyltransferase [Dongia soli]|uniref:RNA methyltransferase n=1 Tax=Dongia soli TaxID=600628 RepID=A0ABU5E7K2_9PROT|nr:RNA methyltransferase [Dongia soli]MDY0882149.1 RNA methyltransferase [Dongia soli]
MERQLPRGYFGIGVDGISKPMNLGAILRTAHAFHASFAFTINAEFDTDLVLQSDTSVAINNMPVHVYPDLSEFSLPVGCRLVGVEITEDAVDLPSFTHPPAAAYVLGAEQDSLSPALIERCDFIVKIPTRFCVNVSVAAALVMYDRMISLGRFAERPVRVGGPTSVLPQHRHGLPKWKKKRLAKDAAAQNAAAPAPDRTGSGSD